MATNSAGGSVRNAAATAGRGDRRIFTSSIRSALGANPAASRRATKPANAEVQPSYQSLDEALRELDRALEQPSTSLLEFEVFLRRNAAKFGDEEAQEAAARLLKYTMQSGEYRFFLKITSDCIAHLNLQTAISRELLLAANDYFVGGQPDDQQTPELFGHVMASRWPPGKGKAIEAVNPVLFVVHSITRSWIEIMQQYGGADSKPETPRDEQNGGVRSEADAEAERRLAARLFPDDEQKEATAVEPAEAVEEPSGEPSGEPKEAAAEAEDPAEEYDEQMATMAALGICTICNVAQRNFWLNAMEMFDEVFMATKHLLTAPAAHLPRNVKQSLLQLYVNLFKWSATGQPKCTSVSTQASSSSSSG
ncbi:hypothetical protein M3Y99_01537900 [Aphelenchoides fujianensis]|nr:hypothetical protein M3Y99_01537900 [Aphelenchoides fujianensis]